MILYLYVEQSPTVNQFETKDGATSAAAVNITTETDQKDNKTYDNDKIIEDTATEIASGDVLERESGHEQNVLEPSEMATAEEANMAINPIGVTICFYLIYYALY